MNMPRRQIVVRFKEIMGGMVKIVALFSIKNIALGIALTLRGEIV
jgi:hypothetical protein